MSAGMAGIIAAHSSRFEPPQIGDYGRVELPGYFYCQCCADETCFDSLDEHAAHVAEELAKAGYGNVQESKADQVRAHTIAVTETTAAGFDFQGCNAVNPHACACLTWVEMACPLCDEPICDGELIQTVTYPTLHSVDYDSMDQEWETDTWHASCADPLAAALADPEGHALVKAIHDRKADA